MVQTQTYPTQRSDQSTPSHSITPEQHSEGKIARAIEDQTAKLPSDLFLWTAGAAAGAALVLELMGMKDKSRFIGQWVPSILICGVYNKIVKTHGHDKLDHLDQSPRNGGPWGDRSRDQTHQIGRSESSTSSTSGSRV